MSSRQKQTTMSPSLSSLNSFMSSLGSSSSKKRTDWTTSKTASLARVNDIRRKETEGAERRRSISRSGSAAVRSSSIDTASSSQQRYVRSSSDGHVNSNNGRVMNDASRHQITHHMQTGRGRSQSADLMAMRANYHNYWGQPQQQQMHNQQQHQQFMQYQQGYNSPMQQHGYGGGYMQSPRSNAHGGNSFHSTNSKRTSWNLT
jgi:hypothetical protein